MTHSTTSAFHLPPTLSAKADPGLIGGDDRHFRAIADSLEATIAELSARLDAERRNPGGTGHEALDRDLEIHRLTARLRTLRRYGLDLCLGRMVGADGSEPVYVGRLGLTDRDGRRLLVDWRSPAAESFFAATHARPMGLASRRRYRWARDSSGDSRITDYWDEVFTTDGLAGHAALDDQSAFFASLGSSRSPQMRDVLGTIAADQDAIIRAGSQGALVVDGGPGSGKTVVALHRAAYLLYADPRLGHSRGGVLVVGPHQGYLAYVADVLPSSGEEGVQRILPMGAGRRRTGSHCAPNYSDSGRDDGSAAHNDAPEADRRSRQLPSEAVVSLCALQTLTTRPYRPPKASPTWCAWGTRCGARFVLPRPPARPRRAPSASAGDLVRPDHRRPQRPLLDLYQRAGYRIAPAPRPANVVFLVKDRPSSAPDSPGGGVNHVRPSRRPARAAMTAEAVGPGRRRSRRLERCRLPTGGDVRGPSARLR